MIPLKLERVNGIKCDNSEVPRSVWHMWALRKPPTAEGHSFLAAACGKSQSHPRILSVSLSSCFTFALTPWAEGPMKL
jgi:hypothetical protein